MQFAEPSTLVAQLEAAIAAESSARVDDASSVASSRQLSTVDAPSSAPSSAAGGSAPEGRAEAAVTRKPRQHYTAGAVDARRRQVDMLRAVHANLCAVLRAPMPKRRQQATTPCALATQYEEPLREEEGDEDTDASREDEWPAGEGASYYDRYQPRIEEGDARMIDGVWQFPSAEQDWYGQHLCADGRDAGDSAGDLDAVEDAPPPASENENASASAVDTSASGALCVNDAMDEQAQAMADDRDGYLAGAAAASAILHSVATDTSAISAPSRSSAGGRVGRSAPTLRSLRASRAVEHSSSALHAAQEQAPTLNEEQEAELQRRRAADAAAAAARAERYYAGNMSLLELVAFRRMVDARAFDNRILLQWSRADELEGACLRFVFETMGMWLDDQVSRMDAAVHGCSAQARTWGDMLEAMRASQVMNSRLSDPFTVAARERLRLRLGFLEIMHDFKLVEQRRKSDAKLLLTRLSTSCSRAATGLQRQMARDASLYRRLQQQIKDAKTVVAFLQQRRTALREAYNDLKAGEESVQEERQRKQAERMELVLTDQSVPASYRSALSAAAQQAPDLAYFSRERSHASASDAGSMVSGGGWSGVFAPGRPARVSGTGAERFVSPANSQLAFLAANQLAHQIPVHAPSDVGTSVASDASAAGSMALPPLKYDWRATDEWVIRATKLGRPLYVHMPSGTTLTKEPLAPPPGYTYPVYADGTLVSPALLPSVVAADSTAPPRRR
ncbi:MAG: hypothetical protein EOO41_00610 [Methanobacteriota archaeon]|nr:MAG: hypothetical protein EOO41_00610 [Euryarchaeota archaeon]